MLSQATRQLLNSFNRIRHTFITLPNNVDAFDNITRSEFRTRYSTGSLNTEQLRRLKERPKHVPTHNLSITIDDPFELLQFEPTQIQSNVIKRTANLSITGNHAFSCSCGSGKTVAGISIMHHYQCRTLIISSRSAVNDQWLSLIRRLYPQLKVATQRYGYINNQRVRITSTDIADYDVYVYSPQYLIKHLDIAIHPSLIIYDEIHSLLGPEFVKTLTMPMMRVIDGKWNEMPYLISFSATFPNGATKEGELTRTLINHVFGSVLSFGSSITTIPVYVWDYRDHFTRTNAKGEVLKGEAARGGRFDSSYEPLEDDTAVEYFCEKAMEDGMEVSSRFKGVIMTKNICTSVYAALYVHRKWNCNVLLIRAADEKSYVLRKDVGMDYEFGKDADEHLFATWPFESCLQYGDVVGECEMIVGTVARLKEGFSVENITWGICTKFEYSVSSRVQILGRVRRSSKDEALNARRRMMYVCSGKVKSTIGMPLTGRFGRHEVLYDFGVEELLFEAEGYVRV